MRWTALTALSALVGTALTAVAIALPNWCMWALRAAPSNEIRWGLWNFFDLENHQCQGWVVATALLMILATCSFFLVLLMAIVVCGLLPVVIVIVVISHSLHLLHPTTSS